MTERTLSERELNRALLARQLLLERANLSLPRAVERIGGLQTQYAPSGYIGLWSRLDGFEQRNLTRALERRTVVQGTLMRGTIHIVSARDYWPFARGIRQARRAWWMRPAWHRQDLATIEATAERVRSFLAAGPRRRAEIVDALALDNVSFGGAGVWIDLVRVPPSGTWTQRRADRYGLAEDWSAYPRSHPRKARNISCADISPGSARPLARTLPAGPDSRRRRWLRCSSASRCDVSAVNRVRT